MRRREGGKSLSLSHCPFTPRIVHPLGNVPSGFRCTSAGKLATFEFGFPTTIQTLHFVLRKLPVEL